MIKPIFEDYRWKNEKSTQKFLASGELRRGKTQIMQTEDLLYLQYS